MKNSILIKELHTKLNMTRSEIEDFVNSLDVTVVIPDGLDDGFVGVAAEEEPPRAVYSIEKCIAQLAKDMSHEEASEYFWYNVAGAGGEGYPLFISTPDDGSLY